MATQNLGARVSPIAVAENWKSRVRVEYETARSWKDNWSFLQHPGLESGLSRTIGADELDKFLKGSAPTCTTVIGANKLHHTQATQGAGTSVGVTGGRQDSVDKFIEGYLKRTGAIPRPLPVEEFSKPLLASHTYGWGPSLERFGRLAINLK